LKIRKGRAVPAESLHITLLFLGSVDAATQSGLEAAASILTPGPFALELDTIGQWRRSGIVWLGPSTLPENLLRLGAELRRIAHEHGIEIDRKPFKPHLTFYRRGVLPGRPEPRKTLVWSPANFSLIGSITHAAGPRYSLIRSWDLER